MSECLEASPEFERLLNDFEALVLPGRSTAGWPPATPLKKWGEDASRSITFSRECALELLRTIEHARIPRGQAVISNLGSGLATLFWGQIFNRVLAVTDTPLPDGRIVDGKYTLVSGALDRTVFVYELLREFAEPNVLVLDESHYSRAISPYYLFRKKLSRPGMIVFVGMKHEGMTRFVADLRSGHLDGIRHVISEVPRASPVGVAIELLGLRG